MLQQVLLANIATVFDESSLVDRNICGASREAISDDEIGFEERRKNTMGNHEWCL